MSGSVRAVLERAGFGKERASRSARHEVVVGAPVSLCKKVDCRLCRDETS